MRAVVRWHILAADALHDQPARFGAELLRSGLGAAIRAEQAIKLIGKRAGLYIELKNYPFYKRLGFDTAEKLAATLKAHVGQRVPQQRQR